MQDRRFLAVLAGYITVVAAVCLWFLHSYQASFEPVAPYTHSMLETFAPTETACPTETAPMPASSAPTESCTEATEPPTEEPETAPPVVFPLDLNRATAEELEQIPGIGAVRAAAIVAYRDRHGGFRSRAELCEVPGIGEVLCGQLMDYVYLAQEEMPAGPPAEPPAEPVPEPEPPPEPTSIPVINLNTATKEQLMLLPGCTEALAESILYMRDELIHVIRNPLEILMAEGMTDALYLAWEPYLAVDDDGGKQLP